MSKSGPGGSGDLDTVYVDAAAEIEVRAGIPEPKTDPINWCNYDAVSVRSPLCSSQEASNPEGNAARPGLDDRRVAVRINGQLRIVLSLVFPSDTLTPFIEETCVLNLSVSGGMAQITAPVDIIDKLLRETHYCRLQFSEDGLPERLLGKVIWVQSQIDAGPGHHLIGVHFEHETADDSKKLDNYLSCQFKLKSDKITSSSTEWIVSRRMVQ